MKIGDILRMVSSSEEVIARRDQIRSFCTHSDVLKLRADEYGIHVYLKPIQKSFFHKMMTVLNGDENIITFEWIKDDNRKLVQL